MIDITMEWRLQGSSLKNNPANHTKLSSFVGMRDKSFSFAKAHVKNIAAAS